MAGKDWGQRGGRHSQGEEEAGEGNVQGRKDQKNVQIFIVVYFEMEHLRLL